MDEQLLIGRILDDEGIAGDLEGEAAETLTGWLLVRARQIAKSAQSESAARAEVESLCKTGRAIAAVAAKAADPAAALEAELSKHK